MKAPVPPPSKEYLKFLAPYAPAIVALALAVRKLVIEEAPAATELVYDAYNAVATGYSFTGRPSDGFVHIAVYPHWVNLGFNFGAQLNDPRRILKGSGRRVRHLRIESPEDLERPEARAFVRAAIKLSKRPELAAGNAGAKSQSVVRAIYPKRRRPVPSNAADATRPPSHSA